MRKRTKWILAAGLSVAGVIGGAGAVMATSADDDAPLTGEQRDKAVAAAKAHVGEGEVTETEMGDDGAAYGVEILKGDGKQVEVNLDRDYRVTGTEDDDDGPNDHEDDTDDNEPDDDSVAVVLGLVPGFQVFDGLEPELTGGGFLSGAGLGVDHEGDVIPHVEATDDRAGHPPLDPVEDRDGAETRFP